MIRHDAGTVGDGVTWGAAIEDLGLGPSWERILKVMAPSGRLRPVQTAALRDARLLGSRRNLVVSAPTNSGKSLIGTLATSGCAAAG